MCTFFFAANCTPTGTCIPCVQTTNFRAPHQLMAKGFLPKLTHNIGNAYIYIYIQTVNRYVDNCDSNHHGLAFEFASICLDQEEGSPLDQAEDVLLTGDPRFKNQEIFSSITNRFAFARKGYTGSAH